MVLEGLLNDAAVLRADAFARRGVDLLLLAHLSREHRRLTQNIANLSSADVRLFKTVVQQIEQEEPAVRQALADLFAGPAGVVHVTGMRSLSDSQQEAIRSAAAFVATVSAMSVTVHVTAPPGRTREAYDPTNCALLLAYTGTPAAVIVHELGHALEHQAASVRQVELRHAFYARRTGAEAPVPLVTVTGNMAYHPTERTKTDQWLHPYIGKLYADVRASELVSMGLQLLFASPVLLADDLEYLDFLYVFLRGAYE